LKFIRAHVIISGSVQGVSFRFYTIEKANFLGIKGWVRNLPTGEVEAVFEGEEDKVKEMVEWCKRGSSFARVKDVKVEFSDYKGEFESFEKR